MAGHPARQLARMAADAAGELRGYTDPADPFPWELTEDDHRAILPRLHHAIADLAVCIDGIAQATGDEHAKQQLAEGIGRLLSGCAHVSAAAATLSSPGKRAGRGAGHHDAACAAVGGRFPRRDDRRRAPGGHHARAAGTRAGRCDLSPRGHAHPARIRAAPRPGKRGAGQREPTISGTPGTSTSYKFLMINCQFELTAREGRTYDASGRQR